MSFSAEPLKKKKRIDPQIIINRLEKKKRRAEKAINQLLRHGKKLKPIDEYAPELKVLDNLGKWQRPKAEDAIVYTGRESQFREWSRYNSMKSVEEKRRIKAMLHSQQKALEELKKESTFLYEAAIQVNPKLLPMDRIGPASQLAAAHYECPDGDYKDITRKWE